MSRIRTAAAVAALVGLVAVATPAHAQYSEGSTWITPFAGAYFGGSLNPTNTLLANKLDVGTAFTFGARLGHKFNNSIGLVFEYAHADPTVTVKGGTAAGETLDLATNVYEATFNFYFGNTPEMMGYIAIGGGADAFSVTADSAGTTKKGSSTQFGTVFGIGGTKMFNEKAGVTLDGRYRWVNVDGANDSYYCGFYGCYYYDTSWYGSGEITLGLVYKFK